MPPSPRRKLALGGLYIALAAGIFSTLEILLKHPAVAGTFHPLQITMERFLVGGLCLIPAAVHNLKVKGAVLSRSDLGYLALIGLLNIPLGMVLFQMSITHGQANIISVIFSGNPIFIALLAVPILHEKLHWNNVVAFLFQILGIIAVMNPFGGQNLQRSSILLALASAFCFSLYSVLGKKKNAQLGVFTVICACFLFGAGELTVLMLLGHTGFGAAFYHSLGLDLFCHVPFFQGLNTPALPYFLIIGIVNSAAGYVFHMLAIETTSAACGSLTFVIKPILAPLLAWLILGEIITLPIGLGILFFLSGGLFGIVPEILRTRTQPPLHTLNP